MRLKVFNVKLVLTQK